MYKRIFILTACYLCIAKIAVAQEAGAINAGGVDLKPALTTNVFYVDNLTYSSEESDEIASWGVVISPKLDIYTEVAGSEVSVGYRLERGEYFSSDADNYTDHFSYVRGKYVLNDRHQVSGGLQFESGHDERGQMFSNGFGDSLESVDTFDTLNVNSIYTFGAQSSPGRINVRFGFETLDYDGDVAIYRVRNRVTFRYGTDLYYKLIGSLNMVVSADRSEVNYDFSLNPETSLNSKQSRILGGITWEVDEITQSFVKLGYQHKNFDSELRRDFSGPSWEVGVTWQPLTYSRIGLLTSRDTQETNIIGGDYIRETSYSMNWQHDWSQLLSTAIRFTFRKTNLIGDTMLSRDDNNKTLQLTADYDFRRWISVGAYINLKKRSSSLDALDFSRNVIGFTVKVTL